MGQFSCGSHTFWSLKMKAFILIPLAIAATAIPTPDGITYGTWGTNGTAGTAGTAGTWGIIRFDDFSSLGWEEGNRMEDSEDTPSSWDLPSSWDDIPSSWEPSV